MESQLKEVKRFVVYIEYERTGSWNPGISAEDTDL
jgi:hypothetical protein